MKNRWKTAFFVLFGLVVIVFAALIIMAILPGEKSEAEPAKNIDEDKHVGFAIRTNREDVNKLVNYYLEKEIGSSPIDYRVQVEDDVALYGSVPFFSQELDMKMAFEPEALENGDLLLKQTNLQVGRLPLPVPYVLDFIRKNYKLPAGVEILPNEEVIYVHMQELKLKSDAKLKANTFDLKNDDISFTLLVPVKE
ncbi:YpmS family protein [Bacillus sp. EB01]|uniref:YpmS family protein n=1 Tax=Bacillus sp. EB01 TaxID=1347086 RepID=UPI0005C4CB17|nr:YpmS family protein [Bacillus sp. EB01]